MENSTQKTSGFEEIYKAGKKQVIETKVGDTPVFIVPTDMKVEVLDKLAEDRRENPLHIKQAVNLLSGNSFVEYFNRFANEHSTIFVDTKEGSFIAVLDYHKSTTEPAHQRHTAKYTCPKTPEWNAWQRHNNEKMSQEDFALFIEDNAKEITVPDATTMLEIAASLKATNNVDFESSIRLENGQTQFAYKENISGQAGAAGQLEIPEKISIQIQPFHSGAAYNLEARFRYRITSAGLIMWYTLIRPHLAHNDAVNDVFTLIKNEMTTGHIIEATY